MKELQKQQRQLLKAFRKEIHAREQYFLSKPETWQDSITGDRYSAKTEMLESFVEDIESTLQENGFN
jgi:phenylalanyl-tRNA synthetase alpha subunit